MYVYMYIYVKMLVLMCMFMDMSFVHVHVDLDVDVSFYVDVYVCVNVFASVHVILSLHVFRQFHRLHFVCCPGFDGRLRRPSSWPSADYNFDGCETNFKHDLDNASFLDFSYIVEMTSSH